MFLRWLTIAASSIMILSCNPTMQSGSLQQAKMRDLSRYEKAGPYTMELKLDAKARAKLESDIREFLWNHWQQRRPGQVTITRYSREGEPSTSSYFVEPDEKGVWHIAVKIDRTLVDRGGSTGQHQESVEYDAYSVERIEVPHDGLKPRIVIPRDEMRAPQSYRLVFKDFEGKFLAEI
jgi:hypothetical protein